MPNRSSRPARARDSLAGELVAGGQIELELLPPSSLPPGPLISGVRGLTPFAATRFFPVLVPAPCAVWR